MAQTEVVAPGEFLYSEAAGTFSRENLVIASGAGVIPAGRMVGHRTVSSTSAAKSGGNTGNGTMGSITTTALTPPGVYALRISVAATNAGTFTVTSPSGVLVGTGTVAVAFAGGGLSFTLADGSTDFILGDGFDITVPQTLSDNYDDAASDGTQQARGILYAEVDATSANQQGVMICRDAEVVLSRVTSEVAGHKGAGVNDLVSLGVFFR
jgi:hypothetical protein